MTSPEITSSSCGFNSIFSILHFRMDSCIAWGSAWNLDKEWTLKLSGEWFYYVCMELAYHTIFRPLWGILRVRENAGPAPYRHCQLCNVVLNLHQLVQNIQHHALVVEIELRKICKKICSRNFSIHTSINSSIHTRSTSTHFTLAAEPNSYLELSEYAIDPRVLAAVQWVHMLYSLNASLKERGCQSRAYVSIINVRIEIPKVSHLWPRSVRVN